MDRRIPLLLAIAVLTFAACRKDKDPDEDTGQTPLALSIPSFITDSGHVAHVGVGNPLTVEGVALGRTLFYEKALSDNYSMSCGSCHVQANGFTDPREFSIGTDGSVGGRNAMQVINMAFDEHFFWDGRRHSLEGQAHDPVTNMIEMRNTWPVVVQRLQAHDTYPGLFKKAFGTTTIDSDLVVMAIAQFERTLLSFNSPFDRYFYLGQANAMNDQEIRGMDVFMRDGHCVDCHKNPFFNDHGLRNNGLDMISADPGFGGISGNAADVGKFKVPTLRNIAHTGPYMHDSRFATLEQVVNFYAHNVQVDNPRIDAHMDPWRFGLVNLTPEQEADLVAFLNALTDEGFLTNPTFSDPH
ncbi:MAG: cytochrome-c peroxidase [Flavobacteriales bacterium]|nr:cytochrome-c peroxidase [Flavobacteriales bacterium]